MCSDEGGGFREALEEADGHYVAGVFGGCGDHCEGTPNDHHAWEEDPWLEVVEREVGGDCSNDVSVSFSSIPLFSCWRKFMVHTQR